MKLAYEIARLYRGYDEMNALLLDMQQRPLCKLSVAAAKAMGNHKPLLYPERRRVLAIRFSAVPYAPLFEASEVHRLDELLTEEFIDALRASEPGPDDE